MGLKGGISNDADSGPLRYVLWCCGSICHQLLTFIQIGYGHAVISTGYLYSGWGIPSSIMPKYGSRLFLIKDKKSTSQFCIKNWALLILSLISEQLMQEMCKSKEQSAIIQGHRTRFETFQTNNILWLNGIIFINQ